MKKFLNNDLISSIIVVIVKDICTTTGNYLYFPDKW